MLAKTDLCLLFLQFINDKGHAQSLRRITAILVFSGRKSRGRLSCRDIQSCI